MNDSDITISREVGLGPGYIVLDGDPASPLSGKKRIFGTWISNGLSDRHELKFGTVTHMLILLTLPPLNISAVIASLACVRLTAWPVAWNWRRAVLSADAGLLVPVLLLATSVLFFCYMELYCNFVIAISTNYCNFVFLSVRFAIWSFDHKVEINLTWLTNRQQCSFRPACVRCNVTGVRCTFWIFLQEKHLRVNEQWQQMKNIMMKTAENICGKSKRSCRH